jgi:hypothetical protein
MALATALERGAEAVIIQEPPPERTKKNKNKKNKEEEEENVRFQMRHPGYNIHRGKRAWTAVKRDLEGWVVERRTDLECGGEGDVVVIDFIPLARVNGRASQVKRRYKDGTAEEETEEGTARCEGSECPGRLRLINVYDAPTQQRPARNLDWDRVIGPRTILAGDFNAHSPMWNPMMLPSKRTSSAGFLEGLIHKHELTVWNDTQATFERKGAGNHSIIDLTLTTPDLIMEEWALEGEKEATNSDHALITWELAAGPGAQRGPHTTSKVVTGWKIEEMGEEEHEAAEAEWRKRAVGRPLTSSQATPVEIEAEAEWLSQTLCEVLTLHAKPKRVCARSRRWWTAEISEKRRILGSLKRMRRKNRASVPAQEIKEARRELRRIIRKAKRDCWHAFLQDAQGKQVWQALRYTNPRTNAATGVLRDEDGNTATTIEAKEELIVAAAFPPPPADEPIHIPETSDVAEATVTDEEVERAVWVQSTRKAAGPDLLDFAAVRLLWKWDRQRLCALIKTCVAKGIHPNHWKAAKGVVLRKPDKPDYTKVKAYRVIALLNCIGKVAEKVVASKLSDVVEHRNLLHAGQFGSRKGRSAVDAVAVLMNRAQAAWKRKEIAGVLLMDVKGAFDHVSRGRLLARMVEMRIEPNLVRWVNSFMEDRRIRMVIDGYERAERSVQTGIPQGSPVSPILFAIYLSGVF